MAMLMLVGGVVSFLMIYRKRLSEQELRVKEMEIQHQQDVIYRTLDAVEDERKRVARDLHDEIGASLSAMRLLVGQLAQCNPLLPGTESLINRFKDVIDTTIDSVRRISSDLLPQGLDELGLTYALEGLCENAMSLADVSVELTVDPAISFPPRDNLVLYRLVQELLNNAIKHAQATNIQLLLYTHPDYVSLCYADDGRGFDFGTAYQQRSLGLKNIETRAQMLHGTVSFDTQPGKGLRVTVHIPT